MKDEEVGELWRHLRQIYSTGNGLRVHFEDDGEAQLIVKLVEERISHAPYEGNLAMALRDFGIDPATWPKEGA